MSKNGMPEGLRTVILWTVGIASIALILLIVAIIFGNLSGNVGFSAGTLGYNNTQNIINNYTASAVNTASQFPTVGTILGVVVLLILLVTVLIYVFRKLTGMASGDSGSNDSFG